MILQHSVLGYYIDLYFLDTDFAIEIAEQGHQNRDINQEVERQKAIEKDLIVNFSELIQIKKILMSLLKLVKYKITLLNRPKN